MKNLTLSDKLFLMFVASPGGVILIYGIIKLLTHFAHVAPLS